MLTARHRITFRQTALTCICSNSDVRVSLLECIWEICSPEDLQAAELLFQTDCPSESLVALLFISFSLYNLVLYG